MPTELRLFPFSTLGNHLLEGLKLVNVAVLPQQSTLGIIQSLRSENASMQEEIDSLKQDMVEIKALLQGSH